MKISIHRPSREDVDDLHQFFDFCIKEAFEKEGAGHMTEAIEGEIADKKAFLEEDLTTDGKERFFLIAKIEQQIIGTIAYGPSGEIIYEMTQGKYANVGEIGTVFVHPDFHNRGIGSLIFNAMVLALKVRNVTSFTLDSGYSIAQKIWTKKLGVPLYTLKDYWGENADHMIWFKELDVFDCTFKI